MPSVPKTLLRAGARLGSRVAATAQNAIEVARLGGAVSDDAASPYEVAVEQPTYRLRRYFPPEFDADRAPEPTPSETEASGGPASGQGPVVVLVPPLMLTADVYDFSPAASAVAVLHRLGLDPWVVDFGAPEHEPGGLDRDLTDHVLAVSDAIDRIRKITGRDVHLAGYSQGGMFAYQTAAYRRGDGIESLITFGSPADTHAGTPFGVPAPVIRAAAGLIVDLMPEELSLPGWLSRTGFQVLTPTRSLRNQLDFLLQLHDREMLAARERQRRFMQGEGWVAWPGPALAEFLRQFVTHNRMLTGGFVIGDRLVTLADITCPILAFIGEVDQIATPPMVRGVRRAAPSAEVFEATVPTGHFGLVAGTYAGARTWPDVGRWVLWCEGLGEPPAGITDAAQAPAPVSPRADLPLQVAAGIGLGAARVVAGGVSRTLRGAAHLTREAGIHLPRLSRLERIRPETRISLGLLLGERARRAPGDVFFLFRDRAYSHQAAGHRIDSIVKGLLEIGVHQGESVGLLMGTRPSALATVAALSRVGAIAVLLRPEGDLERETVLGGVQRIITDPENAARATGLSSGLPVHLLGGLHGMTADARDLGLPLTDMERIDPDQVALPAWYEPDPGRARDLAFVLFTGRGARTRAHPITNGRWALAAFGTASCAALTPADTVFGLTPLHHPAGLLTTAGGALAGGARIALATADDPQTFWEEVRRYGVTVASYTGSLVRLLAEAPPHPGERHHAVRLFMGSGMPAGLWRAFEERFAPARVLEFYTSAEGEAFLANLTGRKPGSPGRPVPGGAEVRIVAWDAERDRPLPGPDGTAIECGPGETGMLVSRGRSGRVLRGLFESGDSWTVTGDFFRRDDDGDFWQVEASG